MSFQGNLEANPDPVDQSDDLFLAYVYYWYMSLHPGTAIYTDIPGLPCFQHMSDVPDIANHDAGGVPGNNILWEARGGLVDFLLVSTDPGGMWGDGYSDWPDEAVEIANAQERFAEYKATLSSLGQGSWTEGELNNDTGLANWFNTNPHHTGQQSDAIYTYEFPTGAIMEIKRPTTPGVLIYRIVKENRPQYFQIGDGITHSMTSAAIFAALLAAENEKGK